MHAQLMILFDTYKAYHFPTLSHQLRPTTTPIWEESCGNLLMYKNSSPYTSVPFPSSPMFFSIFTIFMTLIANYGIPSKSIVIRSNTLLLISIACIWPQLLLLFLMLLHLCYNFHRTTTSIILSCMGLLAIRHEAKKLNLLWAHPEAYQIFRDVVWLMYF